MPGPWIFLKENKDFYESLAIPRGSYLDTHLYDGSHQPQGFGLWRVSSCDKKRKEGWWMEARLIAVSDDHLNWWLRDGPGGGKNRKFHLHLCTEAEASCRKTKKQPDYEFHTDYFRILDVGDIHEKCLPWAKAGRAKEDLEAEQARLQGAAPGGKGGPSGSKPSAGGLNFSVSDEENADSNQEDAADIRKKLDALKKQVDKELPEGKDNKEKGKDPKKAKKDDKNKAKKSSKKKKKGSAKKSKQKKRKRSRSGSRPDVRWFGRARKGSPPSSTQSSSSSEGDSSGSSDTGPKSKKSSGAKGKKSKKRKRSEADRGPYGVGTRLRYDGKSAGSDSDGSDEDDTESHFRAGLSTRSQQLQLLEYAEKKPGMLASRLLQKMKKILARQESPLSLQDGRDLTPSTGTSYYLTVLIPQYRDRLSLRTSRELRSTAKALDLIAQGRQDKAADVLAQRYKALEVSLADQSWSRAQHLELIQAEGAVLTEHDELVMATKEQKEEIRMKNMVAASSWRPPRTDYKGDEKGKSKGQGNGKKGQKTSPQGGGGTENDKPPPS
eukprot:Skav211672  [mRNA]  locus=scaffold216:125247:126899:+ [translate_table: standard]